MCVKNVNFSNLFYPSVWKSWFLNIEVIPPKKSFYLFSLGLCWVFAAAQAFLWLQRAGCSPAAVRSLTPWLLVAEHVVRGLQEVLLVASVCGSRAPELRLSVAVNGLSCSKASGIFPDQGSNLCLLHCSGDSYHWAIREAPENTFLKTKVRSAPAQVGCMRQVLGAGALGRPRGMGWGGRREGGSGWGTHVNPWLIHVSVWQKPLQYCKVISLQLIKKKKKTKVRSVLDCWEEKEICQW